MEYAKSLLAFINKSPSPFHAVQESAQILLASGFIQLEEKLSWNNKLQPGGKYFFTRNGSTIVSFAVGRKYKPGNGFKIVAAHTDSPCLKLKPISKKSRADYNMVGVSVYGGGLWHTWFDRDLGIAGKILTLEDDGMSVKEHLVNIKQPLLKIPTLAIHLDKSVNDGFKFNNEYQLLPLLSLRTTDTIEGATYHHQDLMQYILTDANLKGTSQIASMELSLYDIQDGCIGGANGEFVFSARLDNLYMSFCSLQALVESVDEGLENEEGILLVALFDNEEVGSQSAQGADSSLLESTMRRLVQPHSEMMDVAIHHSFLVSADCAHALHPNYSERYEENHAPKMNQGLVIKTNPNQRYATTSLSTALMKRVASLSHASIQEFVVRNDSPCGSTIGPLLSARTGIRTIDVGCPVLSMHSIREMGGTYDAANAISIFKTFFLKFTEIDSKVALV